MKRKYKVYAKTVPMGVFHHINAANERTNAKVLALSCWETEGGRVLKLASVLNSDVFIDELRMLE